MPISRHTSLLAIAALAATLAVAGPAAAADEVKFATPQAAFEQGLGAYKSGYFEIARPALEHAARTAEGDARFLAEYYLARLYADNAGSQTNHARAYEIYQRIADENADIDPEDGLRAPIVAKVLTALAGYVRAGLPAIGLLADETRAIEYLEFAATFFNAGSSRSILIALPKYTLLRVGVESFSESIQRRYLPISVLDKPQLPVMTVVTPS